MLGRATRIVIAAAVIVVVATLSAIGILRSLAGHALEHRSDFGAVATDESALLLAAQPTAKAADSETALPQAAPLAESTGAEAPGSHASRAEASCAAPHRAHSGVASKRGVAESQPAGQVRASGGLAPAAKSLCPRVAADQHSGSGGE